MKTRKNENKTRRTLPPCDSLHPVYVRYASFGIDGVVFETITDSSRLFALSLIYGDYLHILISGNN